MTQRDQGVNRHFALPFENEAGAIILTRLYPSTVKINYCNIMTDKRNFLDYLLEIM